MGGRNKWSKGSNTSCGILAVAYRSRLKGSYWWTGGGGNKESAGTASDKPGSLTSDSHHFEIGPICEPERDFYAQSLTLRAIYLFYARSASSNASILDFTRTRHKAHPPVEGWLLLLVLFDVCEATDSTETSVYPVQRKLERLAQTHPGAQDGNKSILNLSDVQALGRKVQTKTSRENSQRLGSDWTMSKLLGLVRKSSRAPDRKWTNYY